MKRKYLYSIVVLGFIIGCTAFAINTINEGRKITSNASTKIDVHGACRIIGNSGSLDFFVPTKTAGERATFRSNKPSQAKEYLGVAQCGTTYIGDDTDCIDGMHQENVVICCKNGNIHKQRSCVGQCSTDDCLENMLDPCTSEPACQL